MNAYLEHSRHIYIVVKVRLRTVWILYLDTRDRVQTKRTDLANST